MNTRVLVIAICSLALAACVFKDTECERGSTDPRCPVVEDAAIDATADGGTTDAETDAPLDAPVDMLTPCDDAEVRNDAGACVECVENTDCNDAAGGPVCNAAGRCVECITDANCMDPTKPVCGAGNACAAGCTERADCARFAGFPACHSSGECRPCDPSEETNVSGEPGAGDCGAKSCDPATWTCTTTDRGSLNFCQTCVADSECKTTADGTYRCVNITWTVESPARSGSYCVLDKATTDGGVAEGACPRRAQVTTDESSSLSGVVSRYCSPRSMITTCEAILAVEAGTSCALTCPTGTTCQGGGCRLRCDDGFDCPGTQMCPGATFCQ